MIELRTAKYKFVRTIRGEICGIRAVFLLDKCPMRVDDEKKEEKKNSHIDRCRARWCISLS